jgi:hypothetical protein
LVGENGKILLTFDPAHSCTNWRNTQPRRRIGCETSSCDDCN